MCLKSVRSTAQARAEGQGSPASELVVVALHDQRGHVARFRRQRSQRPAASHVEIAVDRVQRGGLGRRHRDLDAVERLGEPVTDRFGIGFFHRPAA